MIVRLLTYSFLAFLICGCGDKKIIQETVEPAMAQPNWISDRPIQSGYYVGVGSSSKNEHPLDFSQVAKENALLDLASEIRVTISGESFLSTLEVNDYFQEEFISKISTSTKEYLEGYDLMDTWEDEGQYWSFYRLSVGEYNRIRAERKQSAMKRSADNLRRAKSFELEGDVRGAISNYLDGLVGIHEYWTESNEFELNGESIYLDHELHHGFKDLLRDIQIEPNPLEVVLDQMNLYKEDVKILVHLRGNPVRDFPLKYRVTFDGGYNRFLSIRTNSAGLATIRIENVSLEGSSTTRLEIESGMDKLDFEGIEMQVRKPLMDEISFSSRQIPVRLVLPSMSIESQESNLGATISAPMISTTLRSELASQGIRIVSSSAQADYIVRITAASKESGTSQGFHVTHLDVNIEVLHRITGEVVYSWQENSIKGLQLNFESAGKEAYKKAAKKMEQIVGTEIIEAIL
jgi:hypothetical protein